MTIRIAEPSDAEAVAAIHAPVVRGTALPFELEPPLVEESRSRIAGRLKALPWLV
jgi:phosphinothricin acetyltransferase